MLDYTPEAKFIRNQRGGTSLVDSYNFVYRKAYDSKSMDKTYWRCMNGKCPARVNTLYGIPVIVKRSKDHNHSPFTKRHPQVEVQLYE